MRARIFCRFGQLKGVSAEIGGEATLGRSRGATVRLQADHVSAEHARISWDGDQGCYLLEDLGSTNGTALDGVTVRAPEPLGHLHVITLAGEYDFIFQDLERCARRHGTAAESPGAERPAAARQWTEPPSDATTVDEEPPVLPAWAAAREGPIEGTRIEEALPKLPSFLAGPEEPPPEELPGSAVAFDLEVTLSPGNVKVLGLRQGENLVGRGDQATVRIESPEVSRLHAVVTVEGERVTVADLGSSNHTFLRGERIDGAVEVPAGAEIEFGRIPARLVRREKK